MTLLIILGIIIAYVVSARFVAISIEKISDNKNVSTFRIKYVTKTMNLVLATFYLAILISYLGIEYSQITIFISSVFAVIGVALFAQWSILSNITASLIIFFGFPYRVGDHIQVVDKEDDISGIVEEITLFHVLIRRNEDLITYPNTLILQKAVVKRSAINKVTVSNDESAEAESTTKNTP